MPAILGAVAVTPNKVLIVALSEHGRRLARVVAMPDLHAATTAPTAVGAFAALVGLFVMLDSTDGDRRATQAGLRTRTLLTARLGVLALTALLATAVALATTALVFHPAQWILYTVANILIALTYGLIGALLAPMVGRVGGGVRRVPAPVPRPGHHPEPDAAPHPHQPVDVPARLRRLARHARRRVHPQLRRSPTTTPGPGLAHRSDHRRRPHLSTRNRTGPQVEEAHDTNTSR